MVEETDEMVDKLVDSEADEIDANRRKLRTNKIHPRTSFTTHVMNRLMDKAIFSAMLDHSVSEFENLVQAKILAKMLQKKYPALQYAIGPIEKAIQEKRQYIFKKLNPELPPNPEAEDKTKDDMG